MIEQNPQYGVSAADYLWRARAALAEGTPESLFYAAFEIRCGIEARSREYLDAQEHVSKKKKEGWRIAALGGAMDEAFSLGDRGARVTVLDRRTEEIITVLHYRPVNRALRAAGERLGDLLHASRTFHPADDPWWSRTREFLDETLKRLDWAIAGELMGAPLIAPDGRLHMTVVCDDAETVARLSACPDPLLRFQYFDSDEAW